MLVIRNPGVYRMHRAVAILYVAAIFILLFFVLYFPQVPEKKYINLALIVLLVMFALAHVRAAIEVKYGTDYGRRLSRLLGIILLFSFPIGTAIGIYILIKTKAQYWQPYNARYLSYGD